MKTLLPQLRLNEAKHTNKMLKKETSKWTNELSYNHTTEYYTAMKGTGNHYMNAFIEIMLRYRSQKQNSTYGNIPFT